MQKVAYWRTFSLVGGVVALLAATGGPLEAVDGGVTFNPLPEAAGIDFERAPSPRRKAVRDAIDASAPIPAASFNPAFSPMKERGLPGIAIFDYDNDSDLDIYITNGPRTPNSLYQNQLSQNGTLTFVDVATQARAALPNQDSVGPCFGDLDNDGDQDLYVTGTDGTGNRLLENLGNGTFRDITAASGTGGVKHPSGCAMADVNNDGRLDIFVSNTYDNWRHRLPIMGGLVTYPAMDGNDLYVNEGNLSFSEEADARGLRSFVELPGSQTTLSWSPAAVDYDGDGDIDIMTADTQGSMSMVGMGWNRIMENDGTGNFQDVSAARGSTLPGSWMGLSYGDYNCDSYLDFFSTNLGRYMGGPMGNSQWFLGSASKSFTNPGPGNIAAGGLGGTPFGWGTSTLDFDNDGDQDILWHGGDDIVNLISADNPGTLLRNDGSCTANFQWESGAFSVDHRIREVHGVAVGDLNNDGFNDIVSAANFSWVPIEAPVSRFVPSTLVFALPAGTTVFDPVARMAVRYTTRITPGFFVYIPHDISNGNAVVEINSADNGNNWAQVRLLGTKDLKRPNGDSAGGRNNRDGIGSVIKFTPSGGKTIIHPVLGGASHASQDSITATLGLGEATSGTLEILWNGPNGPIRNRLSNVQAGEQIVYPEIPCDYTSNRFNRQRYVRCVDSALVVLTHRRVGAITPAFGNRVKASLLAAFDEFHP
jgi:enediyne biosynthesis protein E4